MGNNSLLSSAALKKEKSIFKNVKFLK